MRFACYRSRGHLAVVLPLLLLLPVTRRHGTCLSLRRALVATLEARAPTLRLGGGGGSGTGAELLRVADKSSKWLVSLGPVVPVVLRRDFVAPFLIVGGILAACLGCRLKNWLKQSRPAGTRLADPGMPSTHALLATYVAVAWAVYLKSVLGGVLLLGAALAVSALRVVCGHHTWAQVAAGAGLGALAACCWMHLGSAWVLMRSELAAPVWAAYVCGSIAFTMNQHANGKIGRRRT
mmetsp:Transcript_19369/g.45427  ORF Transcript_19369/g.45427 Transcript_19369/m.45427 type:complete len:236 (+) Transcript_19369:42-749(+)